MLIQFSVENFLSIKAVSYYPCLPVRIKSIRSI